MSPRNLIDCRQVAKLLGGLHPEHVRKRIAKRPDFPREFRVGAKILFDHDEVLEWIESQRAAPHNLRRTSRKAA